MCHQINVLVHILTGFLHHRACSKINTNCIPFQRTWVHPRLLSGSNYSIFRSKCMFCRSLFVFLYFFLGHCVVCSSSIYGLWLPHSYLQTLHRGKIISWFHRSIKIKNKYSTTLSEHSQKQLQNRRKRQNRYP